MSTLVSAHGLYKFHHKDSQGQPVLKDVSLAVPEGKFVCVMGPSGSGKSTLLHLLSGLDSPSGGHIELDGQDLSQLGEREVTLLRRRTIGYVFQFFNLLSHSTVLENIGLPLAIEGKQPKDHQEQLQSLLERLGLAARADAFPHQLSGGEMQRTSIARALAGGQRLLLADEPTGNLSQKAGREVMEILRRLVDEEGRTVFLVTHNPRDAAFADEVHFLVDGELAEGASLKGSELSVEAVHQALAGLSI